MNEVSTVLVALSRLDAEITLLQAKEKSILGGRQRAEADVRQLEQTLSQLATQHAAALERQTAEETKLRDEQRKIVERRKQLSALGGSKSARLLEREVDVAGRAILQLETKVVTMLEDSDRLEKKRLEVGVTLETKKSEREAIAEHGEEALSEVRSEIKSKASLREENLSALTPQIKQTYTRISARLPGTAVARAESGCCQACCRSLPAQVYNLILGGKELVLCPGCSRILVSGELFNPPEVAVDPAVGPFSA